MPKKSDIEEVEAELAANAAEDERLRELRRRDVELARVKGERDQAVAKCKQAEADLAAAEARQSVLDAFGDKPSGKAYRAATAKPGGKATAVVVMTDWHCEEKVEANTINGLNEHNLELAAAKIKRSFEKSVRLLESARTLSKIDDMVLALLATLSLVISMKNSKKTTTSARRKRVSLCKSIYAPALISFLQTQALSILPSLLPSEITAEQLNEAARLLAIKTLTSGFCTNRSHAITEANRALRGRLKTDTTTGSKSKASKSGSTTATA